MDLTQITQALQRDAAWVVFLNVLAQQAGLPVLRLPTRLVDAGPLLQAAVRERPPHAVDPAASPALHTGDVPKPSSGRPLLTAENLHHTYADGTTALRGASPTAASASRSGAPQSRSTVSSVTTNVAVGRSASAASATDAKGSPATRTP